MEFSITKPPAAEGFARPGYFFIDSNGVIKEKFFEAKYRERLTGNSIIAKLFPELGHEVTDTWKHRT